ncbi:PREDICTED: elongation of very long chain fatty acids protein 2 [Chrysochloris asiatica]|uniref:Elongation of very long chain fatty acids protein 2 n=1 Tax=Chrysochloris asiatica TaxID=185453 RepID=A0A9B0TPD2_CHRAS|nr:PREDICTED: elongation of very long chain fatty acids protein 2 [Chrysochloris asiatica]
MDFLSVFGPSTGLPLLTYDLVLCCITQHPPWLDQDVTDEHPAANQLLACMGPSYCWVPLFYCSGWSVECIPGPDPALHGTQTIRGHFDGNNSHTDVVLEGDETADVAEEREEPDEDAIFIYFKNEVERSEDEHLKTIDDETNAFLDYMFGPRDSRVRGWFMLDSYLPTFFLTVIYLLSIWLGTKYMKNRPALSLRGTLTLYNLGITLLSVYMLVELILSSWEGGYNLQCQDLTSAGKADIRVAKVLWWYYFSKLIEFLDTIFFVLRKKNSQITFLHVYHHASMFNIWWCVLNWIPCGQSFFGPTLNSFIHILMYSYYGLSVFPSMHKYLWWKRYLTQAQLVQFLLTITHTMSAVVRPCGFPFGCLIFQSSYMLTLVVLFLNFYVQTYRKKPMKKVVEDLPAGKEVKNGISKAYFSTLNGVMAKKAQ